MSEQNRYLALATIAIVSLIALLFSVRIAPAHDIGQWENGEPAVKHWYENLRRPDEPLLSCCGEADAYWCDNYYARDGKAFCKITDDRPDHADGPTATLEKSSKFRLVN